MMYPKDINLSNESFTHSLLKDHTFYPDISFSKYTNRTILTILLRLGFILVQIGVVSRINVNFIIVKNILDICCTTVAYFTLGFVLIFNGDVHDLIYGNFDGIEDFSIKKKKFLIGWQTVVISSAIYTNCIIEKTHFICHLLVNILLAGLVQPLFIRWTWMPQGWIVNSSLNDVKVAYRDRAGSGIIHVVGGLVGLIACLLLSKRNTENKSRNIGKTNLTSYRTGIVFLGSLIIFIGLQNFSTPPLDIDTSKTVDIVINNLLAACSCALLVTILHFTYRQPVDHWTTIRCVQALIAGSIMISAAADKYSTLMSIALGCSGGTISYLVSRLISSSELEDHCNIVATHLACGFLANFLAPLCIFEIESNTPSVLLNLSWQLISLIILMGLVIVAVTPVFLILDIWGLLRQKSQASNTKEATDILGMKKELLDRDTDHDRHKSMIDTKSIFIMKSSCERYESQNELSQMKESKFAEDDRAGRENHMRNEKMSEISQSSGGRAKKLRYIYTLPGYDFTSPHDHLADGDKIDINLSSDKKSSSETNLKDKNLIIHSIEDANSDEISTTNNYELRRTQKCMNLREELDKQEIDESGQRNESDMISQKMISNIDTCNTFLCRVIDQSSL